MACPYFMPVAKLENGAWPHPARLPLGCGWNGHCTAPGHEGQIPSQDILEAFCNLGYASSCAWAPQERAWDAVRFSVSPPADFPRDKKTRPAAATILRLAFVCERDHRPVTHGEFTYDLATDAWIHPHSGPRIQRMAECFLDSYLKKART